MIATLHSPKLAHLALGVLVVLLLATAPSAAEGQTGDWLQIQKLKNPESAPGDFFGFVVGVDADTLVAGVPLDGEDDAGSAVVFERRASTGGWLPTATLVSPDSAPDDNFGISVALEGDTLFVGQSPPAGTPAPRPIHQFERDPGTGDWVSTDSLLPADGMNGAFGSPLALSGDALAVGALADDEIDTNAGAVYMFERDPGSGSWQQTQKLRPADSGFGDWFGGVVSMSGNTLVVGHAFFTDRRAAFVFERDPGSGTWTEVQMLEPSSGNEFDGFGRVAATDGNTIVVGAFGDTSTGDAAGAAYIFERAEGTGTWVETQKLLPPMPQELGDFGGGVAIEGDLLFVADPGFEIGGRPHGIIYFYERDAGTGEWILVGDALASDSSPFDSLGGRLEFDGDTLAAYILDDVTGASGALYLFDRVSVGSSFTGGSGRRGACRNETTGESVSVPLRGATHIDCLEAGLAMSPGDVVIQQLLATADGFEFSGAGSGFQLGVVRCRNLTTGETVLPVPEGDIWSCRNAGLATSEGDRLEQMVRGGVE